MNFTEEQKLEAIELGKFYVNLIENHLDQLPLYLDDSVVLDWFGKVIHGHKSVFTHMKSVKPTVTHNFNPGQPSNDISVRTSQVKTPELNGLNDILAVPLDKSNHDIYTTPPNPVPSSSKIIEHGQGDGPHSSILVSPPSQGGSSFTDYCASNSDVDLKYVSLTGTMEFQKVTPSKKLQKTNKYDRPCRLDIGYSSTNYQNCQIHLIVYSRNMPCRRNLMFEFMQYSDSSKHS